MTDLILPLEEPSAKQIIADFPSWDLPGDLSNWFLLMDAIAEANTPPPTFWAGLVLLFDDRAERSDLSS